MLFLIFLLIFQVANGIDFLGNIFYQNNDCKDINFIFYSYNELDNNINKLDFCENINKTLCNGMGTYSNKQFCSSNSLDDTIQKYKNDNFLYYEIYDNICENIIGAFSIKTNKCISFMDSYYIKIIKKNNIYNFNNYLEPDCIDKINNINSDSEKYFNYNNCKNKIKFYDNNGQVNNNQEQINFKPEEKNNTISLRYDILLIGISLLFLILFT
jgi:hypothetical protein